MRRAVLATVLLFLVQSGLCARAGFGAPAFFSGGTTVAGGACPGMDAPAPPPIGAESPAERCKRHCASYARSVPAAAGGPLHAGLLWLPVQPASGAFPAAFVAAPPAPERAPPGAATRLRLASLQI
jgi:hypothetical protein